MFVEGANDVEFLVRLARILHRDGAIDFDLDRFVASNQLIVVPIGGGILSDWWNRLAPLGCHELHLYDGELEPETSWRRTLVQKINSRPNCQAHLLEKRSLENYLHPAAIRAASGGKVEFGDHDCVPDVVVRSWFTTAQGSTPWCELNGRTQRRLRYRAKRWLNTQVVDQMTSQWLAARDCQEELHHWLSKVFTYARRWRHGTRSNWTIEPEYVSQLRPTFVNCKASQDQGLFLA